MDRLTGNLWMNGLDGLAGLYLWVGDPMGRGYDAIIFVAYLFLGLLSLRYRRAGGTYGSKRYVPVSSALATYFLGGGPVCTPLVTTGKHSADRRMRASLRKHDREWRRKGKPGGQDVPRSRRED